MWLWAACGVAMLISSAGSCACAQRRGMIVHIRLRRVVQRLWHKTSSDAHPTRRPALRPRASPTNQPGVPGTGCPMHPKCLTPKARMHQSHIATQHQSSIGSTSSSSTRLSALCWHVRAQSRSTILPATLKPAGSAMLNANDTPSSFTLRWPGGPSCNKIRGLRHRREYQ